MEYLQVGFQSEIISRQFVSQLAFEGQLQTQRSLAMCLVLDSATQEDLSHFITIKISRFFSARVN